MMSSCRGHIHGLSEVQVDLFGLFGDEVAALGNNVDGLALLAPHSVLELLLLTANLISLLFEVDDEPLNDLHQLVLMLDLHQKSTFLLPELLSFPLQSLHVPLKDGLLPSQLEVPVPFLAD